MTDEPHNLILDHLKTLQDGQVDLKREVLALKRDVKDGFDTLNAHDYAQHADMREVRRRLDELEALVARLSTAQGINTQTDH
ncbi:MAG: hypothetical protein AAFQ84_03675 [Pseudomonadota bacterium]